MTDVSNLVPNALSVPSEMKLGELKPSMVQSRVYYTSISPQGSGSFAPGSTAVFRIPAGRPNVYLDGNQSFLRLTVKNNDGTNSISFDNSAYSVINRFTLIHSGNVLEDVLQYNVVAGYLLNQQCSVSEKYGLSPMMGFNATNGDKSGFAIPTSDQYTACLPIMSGVIGTGCSKMLPVGMLADDLQLEIVWETTLRAFYAAAAVADYSITNVELNLAYVEISPEAQAQIQATFGQQVYIAGESFRVAPISLDSTVVGNFTALVPFRFSSLKALHFIPRSSADQVQGSYSLGSNVNPNISSYQIRVGNMTTPNRPVQLIGSTIGGFAEAYVNTQRALHAMSNLELNTCYNTTLYNVAQAAIADTPVTARTAVGANAFNNSFTFALELESAAHKDSVLISGMNTLSSPMFLDAVVNAATTVTYEITSVAHIDHILVLENGILTVRL